MIRPRHVIAIIILVATMSFLLQLFPESNNASADDSGQKISLVGR